MAQPAEGWLASGQEALVAGRWAEARDAFTKALEDGESPDALGGLGEAEWWLGDTLSAIAHGERAYAAFLRRPDPVQATVCAINLHLVCLNSLGRRAVAHGWLQRADRVVEKHGLEPLRGWVRLLEATDSRDPERAARAATDAIAHAERFGDPDLELRARSQLGACLVQMGRVEGGTALLDEAMAAALAGEGKRLDTVVFTSCNTLTACSRVAEVARALQWIRAAATFTDRYGSPHVFTLCRSHHARLLFLTGDWRGAEENYRAALSAGRQAEPALHGEAVAGLAELRLAQGRREDAEELLRGLEGHAAGARVRAAVLISAGEPGVALELLGRRLREIDLGLDAGTHAYGAGAAACLERAELLALQAEAAAAAGRNDLALDVAESMARLGDEADCTSVVAAAALARGRALLAGAGDDGTRARDAAAALERALALYTRLSMPLEANRSRLLWARALAEHAPEAAATAAQTALDAFEDLGAGPDADRAAAFLRELGVKAARRGPKGAGLLTKREREVLELLALGISNRAIGERLSVSLKTVEYHVRNVLSKLGLRNRAEAAAFAVRHLHADGTVDDPLTD